LCDLITQEVKTFPDIGDLGLLHRQFHTQLLFEELRQRQALLFGILKCSLHEDDKVVRVAHHVEARATTCVVGLQAVLRSRPILVTWIGNPALVSLVDGRQINIGQQWRDDTPLRGAGDRMSKTAFDHNVGFQEGEDEPPDLTVLDAASNPIHQHVMIDGVEATLDIPSITYRVREGPADVGFNLCRTLDSASWVLRPGRKRYEVG
jgi:hypothetical protein